MLNRRTVLLAALSVWCLLFVRAETTEKSMVRTVMLEQTAQGWTAGLLYQAPEAAADSSKASAEVRFAAAEGPSLAQALSAAEGLLPQQADYRLCDHLLLGPGGSADWLEQYEQLVLERRCGRLAARVLGCSFTCAELSDASEDAEDLPEKLLQAVKQTAAAAPCLYDRQAGLTVQLLALEEDGASRAEGGVLLYPGGRAALTEAQLQAALLVGGAAGERSFWLEGRQVTVRRAVRSLTYRGAQGCGLRLDCQPEAGGLPPAQPQADALAALCEQTIRLYWSCGADLAGLQAAQALRTGQADARQQKNACPQLQADVYFLRW